MMCVHAIDQVAWLGIEIPDINTSVRGHAGQEISEAFVAKGEFTEGNDCSRADSPQAD